MRKITHIDTNQLEDNTMTTEEQTIKTTPQQRKYAKESLKESIENYSFRITVKEEAFKLFAGYVGKVITKREATKLLTAIQKSYPEATLYFRVEKWGRDARYRVRPGYQETEETVSIESLSSEKIYTQYLQDNLASSITHMQEYREVCIEQLKHIDDLIDLYDQHATERADLARKHERELETFQAQTKCRSVNIDYYLKAADERIQKETKEAVLKRDQEQFEARRQAEGW